MKVKVHPQLFMSCDVSVSHDITQQLPSSDTKFFTFSQRKI